MSNSKQQLWTANIQPEQQGQMDEILEVLCTAFDTSPFFAHNNMKMQVVDGNIQGYIDMQQHLIGNVRFQILHGGVTATILDSIGGIVVMAEMYKRSSAEDFEDTCKKVSRLATLDLRVDYVAPGRGKYFIATAEIIRLGKKSCLTRMNLHNDSNALIATAIASYAY